MKVSACLIVKNEPLLENCLKSIRNYVDEIIVVDTGSDDGTQNIAKKYADRFEIFTNCNDENGLIEDFSMARQRSFDLATNDWILWLDADDLIFGLENLEKITNEYNDTNLDGIGIIFPYEYSYNEKGQCTCLHYRERLFYRKEHFKWQNVVHEVVIPKNGSNVNLITKEEIIYKHQRQFSSKKIESGRNLRILRKYFSKGNDDARHLYYLGLETCNAGLINESITHLSKYIDLSGWDDERVMACLKLVDIYQGLGDYENGLKWAFKSVSIKENWCECYLALSKMFYFQNKWDKCIHFGKLGLTLPKTQTLLFINPLERETEIYKYLNVAYNNIGKVREALECCNLAKDKDSMLLNNKKIYENFLARNEIVINSNNLEKNEAISKNDVENIAAIINNQSIKNISGAIIKENAFPIAGITSNGQEWYIPNTYDFENFPIKMIDEQLQASVIMIWKQYMLHDEVLSAIKFLENAPYNVRHTSATEKALRMTKESIAWITDLSKVQKFNSPENVDVELAPPLSEPFLDNQQGGRFKLVVEKLPKEKISIVDFGSFDGAFTNRYGLIGHDVIGIDLSETSVALANKKAIEFNTGAKHIVSHFIDSANKIEHGCKDFAISTDTYEHLLDPVQEMLIPAKKMLKENGKFLMTTPFGSWMRGEYKEWAHPWLWKKINGTSWLHSNPRGHIIAPTPWTVINDFRKAGFYIKNCYPVLCEPYKDVEGQGNIFVEACAKSPKNDKPLNIIFVLGDGVEDWDPRKVDKNGIGGSELMAINLSKRLAAFGNRVRVYSSCGKDGEGIYDGVEYYETNKYQDLNCDILIVSRRAEFLDDHYNIKSNLILIWVHDVMILNTTTERLLKADRILALTDWHKNNLITCHNLHEKHIIKTRNGIDLKRFDKNIKRNRFKVINSSSPDRSWAILLKNWKEIKCQVPEAELHLYYSFKNWEYSAQFQQGHKELIQQLKDKIKELEPFGVVYHGRINQEKLAEEMLSAGVLAYPTFFNETGYITGMEAQMAGLRIVSSNLGALSETVGNRGVLLNGDWTSKEYQDQFIKQVVEALTKEDEGDRLELQNYAKENFCLDKLAEKWQEMFYELIEDIKVHPAIPYQPIKDFVK